MHKLLSLIFNLQSTIDLYLFKKHSFIYKLIMLFINILKKIHYNANYIIYTTLLYHYYNDNYKKSLNSIFRECRVIQCVLRNNLN